MSMSIRNAVCEYEDVIIKRKDAEFLKAVSEHEDGNPDTTDIRQQTGLTRHQVNHRFTRLEELGFIEVQKANYVKHGGEPPKVATLTEDGENALECANEENIVEYSPNPREIVDDISEVLDEVKTRLDTMDNRVSTIEKRLDETGNSSLEDQLAYQKDWIDVAELKIKQLEKELTKLKEDMETCE
jgi:DNA-binding MarR family transcriptional regulator